MPSSSCSTTSRNLLRVELVGFEALLRWQHPRLGLIPPNKFIPLAEETGLIVPIGNWVLAEACRQLAAWHATGFDNLRMAVNVSTMQFERDDWTSVVERVLHETGVPPPCLELEITESLVMRSADHVSERLSRLREIGVSSAIDDFGTGYSSLKYLQKLPLDALKIDRSFVQDVAHAVGEEPGSTAILRAIVTLAQKLGLRIVAEGVENEQQVQILRDLGCDLMQGFWFSKPMSADACQTFLLARYSGASKGTVRDQCAPGQARGRA